MLFDPKWEKPEVKADQYTLAALIAWLETKDQAQAYDWYNVHGCLMCQYLREACGFERPAENPGFGWHTIKDWGENGYHEIAGTAPFTFGAALERARAVRARR